MNTQTTMAIDEIRARAERQVQELKNERELLVDALDHIMRTCAGSRTQTRRLRWIALRAKCAIEGTDEWKVADVPVNDPLIETLRGLLELIFPIAAAELHGLVDGYSTLSAHERGNATWDAIVESLHDPDDEAGIKADCNTLREFLQGARRAVPKINIDELRKGGDWIEL